MIRITRTARSIRYSALAAAVAAAGLAGVIGAAGSAHASPSGIVTAGSCGSAAGNISYHPGLRKNTARPTKAALTGFVASCKGEGGPLAGFGRLSASLSGTASLGSESFGSGTFTIKWPDGLNPSTGTLSVVDSGGTENVTGTVDSGAFTGGVLNVSYLITSHEGKGTATRPVTSQTFINSQPLTLSENDG